MGKLLGGIRCNDIRRAGLRPAPTISITMFVGIFNVPVGQRPAPTTTRPTFEILASKRKYRQHLAALPIEEKLAMQDALRERALILRSAKTIDHNTGNVKEESSEYRKGSRI